MRLTIIRNDNTVIVDGVGYNTIDLSALDPDIHAIQWYDSEGEIEWKHPNKVGAAIVENERITDITPFQWCVDLWHAADTAYKELCVLTEARLQAEQGVQIAEQTSQQA